MCDFASKRPNGKVGKRLTDLQNIVRTNTQRPEEEADVGNITIKKSVRSKVELLIEFD